MNTSAKTMKIRHFSLAVTMLIVLLGTALGGVANASAQTACSPATAISVPFSKNGAGDFCYQVTSLCSSINSWNLTRLEVNGTAYNNIFISSSSIPPLNGAYTIHYNSTFGWGHFEITGPCGGSATATRTNTPGGPTATRTRIPTTVSGPSPTRTITNTPIRTATQTSGLDPHKVVSTYGRLQISGTSLRDKNGNAIQLAGISSHGLTWFPLSDLNLNNTSNINLLNQQITFNPAQGVPFPYTSSAVGNLVTQWHIEVIRASMFTNDPWNGATAKSYANSYPTWKWYNLNLVNSIVQSAINQNIYVIIDWHAGEGNDPDPNAYWANGQAQEFFTYMVDKWGSYPNVIYETVNSPNNISWASLKTYNQNVINLIRAREIADGYAPNMILAGTPTYSQDVEVATNDPLSGNLIAYNFMWYAGTHGAFIRAKADVALANLALRAPNQTVFMGEVGTTQSTGAGGVYYTEFNTWMEWAKIRKLSWLNWSISDKQEDSAVFVPAILGNVPDNEIAWRGGDGASIAQALASTGFPMRIGPWTDADYSCSGKFVRGWILNNTSQPVPAGCN